MRALCALFAALVTGCAPPLLVHTKSEFRKVGEQVGYASACGNYAQIARFWDEHARKMEVDGQGASHMTIIPEESRAEIVVGKGPYFALMDLKDAGGSRTTLTSFVAGPYFIEPVRGWERQIVQNYPCKGTT
ncbi:hypothetical protein H4CHR_02966 [Variovorax sp. PBS-H4]|uniref:hypothetical protein n=1 Tax=Variovorax sp. PBS-H4 TaxID=434008 RepID=UPI00131898C0|nr:hypothetical protein [Variovorax sp. PBS-H4]VTU32212.1 hypothetical protein H4CHR_02966 [Variovorax sp. PBS-H4]